jgi:CRP-like cAMP-binding protein
LTNRDLYDEADRRAYFANQFRSEFSDTGQDVIVQDEEGDTLYLIVRGIVEVLVLNQTDREQYVETLEDGNHCGEAALPKRVSVSLRAA